MVEASATVADMPGEEGRPSARIVRSWRRAWTAAVAVLVVAAFAGPAAGGARAAAAIGAFPVTFDAVEGNAFNGVVARFSNATNPPTGTVDWGDGQISPATFTAIGPNQYEATGSHVYAEEGTYKVTVTIHSQLDGTANSTANVADAPLAVTGEPIDTVRGAALTNRRVATFTDADPGGTLADYTSTIDWGDGTTNAGAVVVNGAAGFAVNGTHTYRSAGTFSVLVTVHDAGGASASTTIVAGIALPGGQIAFQRGTTSEIWLMNADGSGQRQLTAASAGQFWDPAWSADGQQLAMGATVNVLQRPTVFASSLVNVALPTVPVPGVWTMNADASGLARLAVVPRPQDAAPNWSRDGRFVAYTYSSGARDIFLVSTAASHALRQLTNSKANFDPAWAPNDKVIAFTDARSGPTQRHLFRMNPDGSGHAPLTTDTAEGFSPAWSPDAGRLAFARSVAGGPSQIYVVGAGGGGLRMLTSTTGDNPTWSPDGTRIAFTALLANGRRDIHVINADGTGEHRIATNADEPAWRPTTCSFVFGCLNPVVSCVTCAVVAAARVVSPAFRVGSTPTATSARAVPNGTTFVYRLSAAARVQIRILRIRAGRLRGRRCVTRGAPRSARACLAATRVGTLRRRGHRGTNRTRFSGRIGTRALAPGHYQAEIIALDARGRSRPPALIDFDVVA